MATQKTYIELLQDPRWQRKRFAIFTRDKWTCQKCNSQKNSLHCHHKFYINGRMPWEYSDEDLVTVCAACHGQEHGVGLPGEAIGVCIPFKYQCDAIELFEVLLLMKKEPIGLGLDYYVCQTISGNEVYCTSEHAAIRLNEGQLGDAWLKWARRFQSKIIKDSEGMSEEEWHP